MQLSNLSPDVVALVVVAASVAYGVFRGAGGVRILILGAAAGVIAADGLSSWLPQSTSLPGGTTQVGIAAAVLIGFALTQHRPLKHGSAAVAALGGAVAGAFAVSEGLTVIPSTGQSWLSSHSFILLEAKTFHQAILIAALAIGIVIPPLYHRQQRSHH